MLSGSFDSLGRAEAIETRAAFSSVPSSHQGFDSLGRAEAIETPADHQLTTSQAGFDSLGRAEAIETTRPAKRAFIRDL